MRRPLVWGIGSETPVPVGPESYVEEIEACFRRGDLEGAQTLIKEEFRNLLEPFLGGVLTERSVEQMRQALATNLQHFVGVGAFDSFSTYVTDLDPRLPEDEAVAKASNSPRPAWYIVAEAKLTVLGPVVEFVYEVSA